MNAHVHVDDPHADAASGARTLDDRAEIDAWLRRLCRFHSLISVRCGDDAHVQASVVLLVQNLLRRIIIDALPERFSAPGTTLHLRSRFDGAELMFDSRVIGRVQHEGQAALAIALPNRLRVRERRAARRLSVPPAARLPASVARHEHSHFRLALSDVSSLGAGGIAHDAPVLMAGDRIELLIELPGNRMTVPAEIRSVSGHGHELRLGLRFSDLRAHHLDRLSAALLRLERHELRAQHDN